MSTEALRNIREIKAITGLAADTAVIESAVAAWLLALQPIAEPAPLAEPASSPDNGEAVPASGR